jgi:hypothetical protein
MTGHIPSIQLIAIISRPRMFVMAETLACGFTVTDIAVNTLSLTGKTSLHLFC